MNKQKYLLYQHKICECITLDKQGNKGKLFSIQNKFDVGLSEITRQISVESVDIYYNMFGDIILNPDLSGLYFTPFENQYALHSVSHE
jgi:hypothetical protein